MAIVSGERCDWMSCVRWGSGRSSTPYLDAPWLAETGAMANSKR